MQHFAARIVLFIHREFSGEQCCIAGQRLWSDIFLHAHGTFAECKPVQPYIPALGSLSWHASSS